MGCEQRQCVCATYTPRLALSGVSVCVGMTNCRITKKHDRPSHVLTSTILEHVQMLSLESRCWNTNKVRLGWQGSPRAAVHSTWNSLIENWTALLSSWDSFWVASVCFSWHPGEFVYSWMTTTRISVYWLIAPILIIIVLPSIENGLTSL